MPKNKKKKRDAVKHPALHPELNIKTRYNLINDYNDYHFPLDEASKDWLNKFTDEYVNGNLDRENLENNIHKTTEYKKGIDKMNNLRNSDVYTRAEACGKKIGLDDLNEEDHISTEEDEMIESLDEKKKK